ncbi:hypothetical protein A3SI_05247 [Nitritalea halalkaliphila LW7]|uniref:Uncharacterized protein n=2 Tax=Nitritalea TaxID=1187887 RepID=I5C7Q6_9BACT|nr:hypothetical protein A3SI_05247 [Nitritalea halalkaliphila LW7]
MKAEKTQIYLKNMRLLQERDPATPLNAEGFEIELSRFELLLADSVHTIFADNVSISSLESFIRAKALRVRPNFEKESKTYLELGFNQLAITEADINRSFIPVRSSSVIYTCISRRYTFTAGKLLVKLLQRPKKKTQ